MLALDQSLQGRELGGQLLVDALQRILIASANVAARLVALDALDEAVASKFYEPFGFERTEPGGTRLVRALSGIARDFE
jgi:GNAT superfamily N-acetyltransferase